MTPGPEVGRCWLDRATIEAELRAGLRVAVDTRGIDPALSALALGAREVGLVAGDPGEEARRALEVAALQELPVQSTRSLLGYGAAGRRVWFYHHLRPRLPAAVQAFWDAREERIRLGIIHQGDRERSVARVLGLPAVLRHAALLRWRTQQDWRRAVATGGPPGAEPWIWLDPAHYPRGRTLVEAAPGSRWDLLITDREPRVVADRVVRFDALLKRS